MDLSKYKLNALAELEPFRKINEESFFKFYTEVHSLLNRLPEGYKFYIPDKCTEDSYELFVKFVCFYIWEETKYTHVFDGRIDLSEDCCWVSRSRTFVPSKPLHSCISRKSKKE